MKKIKFLSLIFNFILIIAVCRSSAIVSAKNESTSTPNYSRVLDENTVFYADPGCTIAKFVLPYGYFVKVLSVAEDSVAVRYMDGSSDIPERDGFILTKCYYPCEYTSGDSPYPDCKLKLIADEVLFSDSKATAPKTVLSAESECRFYGYCAVNGEQYYCVYANGYIGYVRAKAFVDAKIPPHALPVKSESDPDKESPASDADSDGGFSARQTTPDARGYDSTIKTVVVIAVSLVALSVVYLLFKPTHKNRYAFTDKDSDDLL